MSGKDKPYIELNVNDFMNDEAVRMCDATAIGVYIYLICIMHKSKVYGTISLSGKFEQVFEQKDEQVFEQVFEQNLSSCLQFVQALVEQLSRIMPFSKQEIENGLLQLIENNIVYIEGKTLVQKRMVRDAKRRAIRSSAGISSAKKRGFLNDENEYEKNDEQDFVRTSVRTDVQTSVQTSVRTPAELLFRAGARAQPLPIYVDKGNNIRGRSIEGGIENERGVQGVENSGGIPDGETNNENVKSEHLGTKVEQRIVKNLMDVELLLEKYFTSPLFARQRESVAMANYRTMEDLIKWGQAFNQFLISNAIDRDEFGNVVKTENDWARHFARWIQKQDLTLDPDKLTEERRKKFLSYRAKFPEKNQQKITHELDQKIASETNDVERRKLEFLKFRLIPPDSPQ